MGDKLSVVTGATGHVGYALVKELEARGENFRILIRKDSKIFDNLLPFLNIIYFYFCFILVSTKIYLLVHSRQ
mgnify:CR=1 FL=1